VSKLPHTAAKITAHRQKPLQTPSRWHLLPYTAQKIDRNPPKVITREDCKSTNDETSKLNPNFRFHFVIPLEVVWVAQGIRSIIKQLVPAYSCDWKVGLFCFCRFFVISEDSILSGINGFLTPIK